MTLSEGRETAGDQTVNPDLVPFQHEPSREEIVTDKYIIGKHGRKIKRYTAYEQVAEIPAALQDTYNFTR